MAARILISNDDGIAARGIAVLERALADLGEVWVVAPDGERSASSHSLTLRRPVPVRAIDDRHLAVGGTPTDCVVLATQVILDAPPDLVVSGINHGPNMGEDVHYSGTVAAAVEAAIVGLPAVAISALQRDLADEETHTQIARMVVARALEHGIPERTLLNVNIPDPGRGPIRGLRVTKLGSRAYENFIEPSGRRPLRDAYTIGGNEPVWRADDGSDIAAIRGGYVSVTPLDTDMTNYRAIVSMERWRVER